MSQEVTKESIKKLNDELQMLTKSGECDLYRIQTLQTKLENQLHSYKYAQLEKRITLLEDKLKKYEEN